MICPEPGCGQPAGTVCTYHGCPGRKPHDAHVVQATKLFRDCGFTLAAMQYPRCAEALAGLKRFNRLTPETKVPVAWHYFPNAYMRDNWREYYG